VQDFVARKPAKKTKSTKSLSKLLILLVGLVSLIVGLVVIVKSLHFGDFFRSFDNQTLLLVHNNAEKSGAYLISADFTNLSLEVVPLDTEVEVDLGDYGNYRLQAVYPLLASVEKKPVNFVRLTYSFSLGRVIDEVWGVDQVLANSDQLNDLKQPFFSREFWQFPGSLGNKLAWWSLISDPRTEVNYADLATSFPLEKRIKNTDSSLLLCTIAVINTTSVNGLAGRIEQVLDVDGFSIIRTDSEAQTLAKTELVVSTDQNSQTNCRKAEQKLIKLLPGKVEVNVDDVLTKTYRADLVVKLGEDLQSN